MEGIVVVVVYVIAVSLPIVVVLPTMNPKWILVVVVVGPAITRQSPFVDADFVVVVDVVVASITSAVAVEMPPNDCWPPQYWIVVVGVPQPTIVVAAVNSLL